MGHDPGLLVEIRTAGESNNTNGLGHGLVLTVDGGSIFPRLKMPLQLRHTLDLLAEARPFPVKLTLVRNIRH